MNCSNCGTATMAHFRFCGSCGGELEARGPAQVASIESQIDPNVLMILAAVFLSCTAITLLWH